MSDVVPVVVLVGNAATQSIAVTAGVTIAPASVRASPGGSIGFGAAGGSGSGYAWSLTASGAYVAGTPAASSTSSA